MKTISLKCGLMLAGLALPVMAYANRPTNFFVILMDDMGLGDIEANGAIGYSTPNINRLQSQSLTFTRYYAPQAVSGASRAGLLTGCYPNRIGMHGAPGPNSERGISAEEMTIAEVLKQKDYQCAAFGKWHLGDHRSFLPLQHGFDEFYGIPYSNDMWPNHPTVKFPDLPLIEGNDIVEYNPDQTQFTKNFTQRAVNFIKTNRNRPFFVYLAHPMPHVPLFVSDDFKGKSEQGLYGDVMMEIDWSIGTIFDTLKELKLDDNTVIVVTSDNGPWLNYGNHAGNTAGLREGKGVSFEGGQRVPCIVYWKGHTPEGGICHQMVSGIDLLATFADIADAPMPPLKTDGVSLVPYLNGDYSKNLRTHFAYYYRANDLEAVTDGHYKLIYPHKHRTYEGFEPGNDGKPGKVDEWHQLTDTLLYDLRRDPGERYNIIRQYPEVVKRLNQYADSVKADLGDNLSRTAGKGCRQPGQRPPK